jgi:hydrogenase maturation protein HypF
MIEPPKPLNIRKHIQVRGIVQGVGFRPFVYKLAKSSGLSGYVFNSSAGVTIEIEGPGSQVEDFLRKLKENPPQLAEIAGIAVSEIAVQGGAGFSILNSREEAGAFALISPDTGTCADCW